MTLEIEAPSPAKAPRERIIDALMQLAAERAWEDFTLSDVAERAGVTLAEFRDAFPSKGALLAGYSRRIDQIVLKGGKPDSLEEGARDRLFDVLMRRLDAMMPEREALRGIRAWVRREPMAAAALNGQLLNSMRFMLEAAGIASEGPVGALKLQGLVLAWSRILDVWFEDDDPGLAKTMAALDKALERGGQIVARAEDFHRLTAPLRTFAGAILGRRRHFRSRMRERFGDRDERQAG